MTWSEQFIYETQTWIYDPTWSQLPYIIKQLVSIFHVQYASYSWTNWIMFSIENTPCYETQIANAIKKHPESHSSLTNTLQNIPKYMK